MSKISIENQIFCFQNSSRYNFLTKITRTDIQLYQINQKYTTVILLNPYVNVSFPLFNRLNLVPF